MKRIFCLFLALLLLLSGCKKPDTEQTAQAEAYAESQREATAQQPADRPEALLPQIETTAPEQEAPAEADPETPLSAAEESTPTPSALGVDYATVGFWDEDPLHKRIYSLEYYEAQRVTEILFNLNYDPNQLCKCADYDLTVYATGVGGHSGKYYVSYGEAYARTEVNGVWGQAALTELQIQRLKENTQKVRSRYLPETYTVKEEGIFSPEYSDYFVASWRISAERKDGKETWYTAKDLTFLEDATVTYEHDEYFDVHHITACYTDATELLADAKAMDEFSTGSCTLKYTAYRTKEGEPLPDLTRDETITYEYRINDPITAGTMPVEVRTAYHQILSLDVFSRFPVVAMEASYSTSPTVTLYLSVFEKSEMDEVYKSLGRVAYFTPNPEFLWCGNIEYPYMGYMKP